VKQQGLIMTLKSAAMVFWAALIIPCAGFDRAASQESDVNAYIAKAPIAGVPNTPYGQWNEEQKKGTFKRVVSFCEFLCVDSHAASYPNKAAADRATAEAKTCLGACVVNHLPQDFPQLAALKAQLRSDYEKAKQLGSSIAWPPQGK
jgi:hypothetical protein